MSFKHVLYLLFSCLTLGACTPTIRPEEPNIINQGSPAKTPNLDWNWILVTDGDFEPSPVTVSVIQSQIQEFVEAEASKQQKDLPNWEEFTFQYQGQTASNQEYIYINALCDVFDSASDLDQYLLDVSDGGPCYFQLKYDLEKGNFYELMFNGEA